MIVIIFYNEGFNPFKFIKNFKNQTINKQKKYKQCIQIVKSVDSR